LDRVEDVVGVPKQSLGQIQDGDSCLVENF